MREALFPNLKIPLVNPRAENALIETELTAAFQRVLQSGQFILGPEVLAFEEQVAKFLNVKHALTVSSGTDALLLGLMALGIQPGDEVLCPAFTFFATAGSISRVGAIPVFVDVSLDDFNFDVEDARKKITSKTKAIMPVHLFGQSAAMTEIMALAKEFNLQVLEDCAQAIGATYRGTTVGTIGDFGAYSFFPTKNLGAFGDAGLLVTPDDHLAEKAKLLRNHGAKERYYHEEVGGNFRLDAIQCAMLAVKLPHLPAYSNARRTNAAYYLKELAASEGIVLPTAHPHNGHIWNQFTIRLPKPGSRDALKKHLADQGISSEVYYPVPLHRQQCFAELPFSECPNAELLCQQVLSIPVYPHLQIDARHTVTNELLNLLS